MFVSQPRYVTHLNNGFDELRPGSLAHTTPLSLKQEESMFIFSHFTGEMCYAITEEWSETNSVHISQSQDVLQSLLSSSTDLVRQLAEVMDTSHNTTYKSDITHSLSS